PFCKLDVADSTSTPSTNDRTSCSGKKRLSWPALESRRFVFSSPGIKARPAWLAYWPAQSQNPIPDRGLGDVRCAGGRLRSRFLNNSCDWDMVARFIIRGIPDTTIRQPGCWARREHAQRVRALQITIHSH